MVEVAFEDVAAGILIEAALDAAANAHAPYSGFAVGAALLLDDGAVITGANLENASYGLSLCAETVAVGTANASGRLRKIVALAVIGGNMSTAGLTGDAAILPCGRCRQILSEAAQAAGHDIVIHCASADGSKIERYLLSELLPHAFGPHQLARSRAQISPASGLDGSA